VAYLLDGEIYPLDSEYMLVSEASKVLKQIVKPNWKVICFWCIHRKGRRMSDFILTYIGPGCKCVCHSYN